MAWTTPRTWSTGDLVTASHMNEQVRDNQTILKSSIDNNGKIVAISSTYFASLDGSNLTGVAKLAAANTFTTGIQSFNGGASARLVVPVGASKWST